MSKISRLSFRARARNLTATQSAPQSPAFYHVQSILRQIPPFSRNDISVIFFIKSFIALFITICLFSCGHKNSSDGVAEAFLFRYFLELNQRGALELSTGLAEKKLLEEIELTQNVRMQPNLDLAKHKPFLDYNLVSQNETEGTVTFFYDITVEIEGGPDRQSQFVLSTMEIEGKWKVNNYDSFIKR